MRAVIARTADTVGCGIVTHMDMLARRSDLRGRSELCAIVRRPLMESAAPMPSSTRSSFTQLQTRRVRCSCWTISYLMESLRGCAAGEAAGRFVLSIRLVQEHAQCGLSLHRAAEDES